MSIVIIGGNERMECKYKDICREFNCTAKVYTKSKGDLARQIGEPDLIILFTNPVSHKMAQVAKQCAARRDIALAQSHCGSCNALRTILSGRAANAIR
jgi:hypothetical protein